MAVNRREKTKAVNRRIITRPDHGKGKGKGSQTVAELEFLLEMRSRNLTENRDRDIDRPPPLRSALSEDRFDSVWQKNLSC